MRRWVVRDVMTTDVATVGEETSYKEIVELLAGRAVSALPVVDDRGRVVGVVSEADLLPKLEFGGLMAHVQLIERRRRRVARAKASGTVASELMSSPAHTIGPDASLVAVAKIMDDERLRRLPVVDEQGRLVGIVARRDLLRGYLRTDDEIRQEILDEVLDRTLWMADGSVFVSVSRGMVTLSGQVDRLSTARILSRLCEGVAGVVAVEDELEYDFDDSAIADAVG